MIDFDDRRLHGSAMSSLTDDYNAADHSRAVDNEPMLRYFGYDLCRPDLQQVSDFLTCAASSAASCRAVLSARSALRKLLEAKDAAVRAKVYP